MIQTKRVVFFVNHATFFVSHRLHIARLLKNNGFDIFLIFGTNLERNFEESAKEKLREEDIKFYEASFSPRFYGFFRELIGFFQAATFIKKINPSILHTISPKGFIFGGLIARFFGIKNLIISISGMGYLFTHRDDILISRRKRLLQFFIEKIYRFILNHNNINLIVQNIDDYEYFLQKFSMNQERVHLIQGSGINFKLYNLDYGSLLFNKEDIVLFAARLLSTKGVEDFYEVASKLKTAHPKWRFIIAGDIDINNPDSISKEQLKSWRTQSNVEFLGYQENIHLLFLRSKIHCLPSYREGFPKTIMEASICAVPSVTYNSIGCRDAVINNETGIIVNTGELSLLEKAIENLIVDEAKRENLGRASFMHAKEFFSQEFVSNKHLEIYKSL